MRPWRYVVAVVLLCLVAYTGTALAETDEERRLRLESELAQIEQQIVKQQALVDGKKQERQSLERDVAILDAQIKKSQLAIQARGIEIQKLGTQIGDKQIVVNELNDRTRRQLQSLGQLIRKTNEIDHYSLTVIVFGERTLSEFFEDLENFQSIKSALRSSLKDLADIKTLTLEQKTSLEGKQQNEIELKKLQELEKKEIEAHEREKGKILKETKGQEAEYQALLKSQQQTASEIRMMLFELRDSGAIPFPDALRLAEFASAKTGVRPALIMAVLTQETQLGDNLGVIGRWQSDMHPTRDQPIFKVITATLGLDPNALPVSRAPSYGYGGAMGPAQFIPSTWAMFGGFVKDGMGSWIYDKSRDRIRQLTGKGSPSNPYDNQDAFVASGLLMADNGASAGTRAAERLAALRYFAGWGNASNPAYAFYGDGVMGHADRIQRQIEILQGG